MAVVSRVTTPAMAREQTRARYPDETGFVVRDGVRVFWERYGDGGPTILLMPTWSIMHSRHWKLQIPYLARHFRVVTFDGRGNGRSDRPADAAAYADTEFVADASAVMDATGTDRAVAAGMSMGAGYAVRLAVEHPDRIIGLCLFASTIPVNDRKPEDPAFGPDADFDEVAPDDEGWNTYNADYWRRDWPGFAAWFSGDALFTEPHSTKAIDDAVGWFLETDAGTITTAERAPYLVPPPDWERPRLEGYGRAFLRRVQCPALVVHGTDDHVSSISIGRQVADALDATYVEIEGGGHSPIGREPVLSNRLIRDFVRGLERIP